MRALSALTAGETMNEQPISDMLEDLLSRWPGMLVETAIPAEIESQLSRARAVIYSAREQAASLAEQAVTLARQRDEPVVLASTLYQAAVTLKYADRPDRAFVMCLQAQPLFERLDDRWRASRVTLLRGDCYLAVGEHERALELINESARRFFTLGDRVELSRCYASMATAHRLGADLRQAVDHAAKALETLHNDTNSPRLRLRVTNNEAYLRVLLGRQLADQGEPQLAHEEYVRAAQTLAKLGDIDLQTWSPAGAAYLDTMVEVHIAVGDRTRAASAVMQLAVWARRWKSPFECGLAWLRLADFRIMQGAERRAITCVRRAIKHLQSLPLRRERVAAQSLLARLLENGGDQKGAYEAYCQADRIETEQQRETISMRAELLTLDSQAEQDQRKTEQTLEYAQRLSNVGHMVASVNHELNQPMATIKMLAETTIELIDCGDPLEAHANIQTIQKLSARLVGLTSKLAAFPAQKAAQHMRTSVKQAVSEALVVLQSRLAQTPCEVTQDTTDLDVLASEDQLVRVIVNLLNNALDAMQDQGQRRIVIAAHAGHNDVTLSISDNGPGIAANMLERLFEPFFSSKVAGQGLGLGLALSRDVVREMGGSLSAENGADSGAVFRIVLPLASD
jgi:C4-dicarboxylate-specific signal transduction histidine kinase